ncbi:hypothetical protein M1L60_24105 [Actinoplanes sp. TRM 88003]|uniref:Uncharacterized protein n=1 Tax=Paractinoplanes aksuensis TaxID=2939490 RepID=A0ABT1DS70_9ACTN|nr:hypothetical protein [Actinoplanes aksuensis]MCO8273684.1 hypothetical protein [Actinoplanes aksuensis]
MTTDPAGLPWLIENSQTPSAKFASYSTGAWTGVPAPQPPDAVGLSLHGIAGTPGRPLMLAVGGADLPTTPRYVKGVVLEYGPGPSGESSSNPPDATVLAGS